jgi:type I restriction enzyme, S subunit
MMKPEMVDASDFIQSLDEFEVPEGWTIVPLGKCVDILDNLRIPVNNEERKSRKGSIPYYGATGQVGWIDDFLFDEELLLLGEDGAPFNDKSKSITYIITGKSWVNNHAHVLRAIKEITSNSYLKHYLNSFDFSGYITGSTRDKLNQGAMKKIPILLPPLAEQQRIVTRIEALLSHVDAAGDRLSQVPAIMKKFRQSVLASACSGRLTEEWREENPDIETSFRFLERFFKGKVEPITDLFFNDTDLPDIPESWLWIEFGKIISELKNGVYLVGPNLEPPGNPILRISSVRPGKVSFDDVKYLPDSDQYIEDYHLKDKDLLFTRYNGSLEFVGISGMVRDLQDRILLYPDKLIRVRFDQSGVMPEYAEMFFQSFNARTNIYSVIKSSAGQKGISGKDIKIQPFPLPPLAEQREIVHRVGLLFERADAIEREVAAAGRRCEWLTQGILTKGLAGRLLMS